MHLFVLTYKIQGAGHQWLMPVILATQGRDQGDRGSKPAPGK
jgi:hypothetical protein